MQSKCGVPIAGTNRISMAVRDMSSGQEYRFLPAGPQVSLAEFAACRAAVAAEASPWLVLSGSLPPGVPVDGYAEISRDAARRGQQVVLDAAGPALRIDGGCLSLLGVGADSLYHWTIDGIGRLAAADAAALDGVMDLLLPAGLGAVQRALLARAGMPEGLRVHEVAPGMVVRVARLVVPWSIESDFTVGGNHRPHPCLRPYFARVTAAGAAPAGSARVYIDRRGSPNRRMLNEDAVVAALAGFGFVPVRLEALDAAAQIGVFAHAEAIVAPHGAGLAHLVHARPGTKVLELHAAHWVNWCFRRHAAVLGLEYDCIAGPAVGGRADDHVNTRSWAVPVTHLQAAVSALLGG